MEHLDKRQKAWVMVAIIGAMLFASLNQTIVGTVLPRIVSSLGGVEYLTWVFTLYMLTSSVSAILAGRLSDLYGRKPFLVAGVVTFSLGSFLCGLSGSIYELIAWRGLQGVGGGLVMSSAFAAVADLYSPRERGRWQGILGAAFGLASVLGPTLGGAIVDHFDWHWVFWIFLPLSVPALLLLVRLFPSVPGGERQPVDVAGAGLLCATLIPLLLAFSWAGTRYAWGSLEIGGLLAAALVAGLVLVVVEKRAAMPAIPLGLFSHRTIALSNGVSFLIGGGMFGAVIYVPMFVQGVLGASATTSGFATMPMTLGLVVAASISGQVVTRTGRYKALALLGLVVLGVGTASLALLDRGASMGRVALGMAVAGLGIGVVMPIFTLTVQNAASASDVGVATASAQLSRQLGGVIGASVMGTVLAQRMSEGVAQHAGALAAAPGAGGAGLAELASPRALMNSEGIARALASLPPDLKPRAVALVEAMRGALTSGVQGVFWLATGAIGVAAALALLLREEPLRTSNRGEAAEA